MITINQQKSTINPKTQYQQTLTVSDSKPQANTSASNSKLTKLKQITNNPKPQLNSQPKQSSNQQLKNQKPNSKPQQYSKKQNKHSQLN